MDDETDGFMNAIGLLLEKSTPEVRDVILKTIHDMGDDLYLEVAKQSNGNVAAADGVDPCEPGTHWDTGTRSCMPNPD